MPVYVTEKPRQTGDSHYLRPGATREYTISGTYQKLEAQLALMLSPLCPAADQGIDSEGNVIPIYRENPRVKEKGGGVWEGMADYVSSGISSDLQFTFGSTSAKIFEGIAHVRTYDIINNGVEKEDIFKGVIGDNDKEVEGVEIEVGEVQFSLTKKYQRSTIAPSYFNELMQFLGDRTPINNAEYTIYWKGVSLTFPTGSLRCRSVPLKWSSADELEYVYNFAYARPVTTADNFKIGGVGPVIEREGWEYGWIRYKLTTENNRTIKTAEYYNVEQVYPKRSFGFLQL